MSVLVADAEKTDVQALIAIYSSPHLYHNCEDASWFVKSYFDYHHLKVAKIRRRQWVHYSGTWLKKGIMDWRKFVIFR